MKKSTLALTVAAILASPLAAQADTVLYGSARVSVDYNDEKTPSFNNDFTALLISKDRYWDVVNNDSRLGIQGSEDLGGGLSVVYQYEFGVDLTEGGSFENNRPKFVGLKGNFGTLTVGTQETPYYHIAGVTDIFNSGRTFVGSSWLGGSFNGFFSTDAAKGLRTEGSLTRLDNSVYYTTPDFSGFTAEAMLVMNGSRNIGYSDGIDIWNVAAKYSNGPFFAGASYIKLEGRSNAYPSNIEFNDGGVVVQTEDLDLDQWVVGLGYNYGPFSLGFIYEQGTFNQFGWLGNLRFDGIRIGGDDATNYYLSASYTFGNSIISAAYGQLDPGIKGAEKIDNYILGYQYNLSKRTRLWVEYIGRSADPAYNRLVVTGGRGIVYGDSESGFYGDQNAISIGTRVDF